MTTMPRILNKPKQSLVDLLRISCETNFWILRQTSLNGVPSLDNYDNLQLGNIRNSSTEPMASEPGRRPLPALGLRGLI